jgi:hypothetical protein
MQQLSVPTTDYCSVLMLLPAAGTTTVSLLLLLLVAVVLLSARVCLYARGLCHTSSSSSSSSSSDAIAGSGGVRVQQYAVCASLLCVHITVA